MIEREIKTQLLFLFGDEFAIDQVANRSEAVNVFIDGIRVINDGSYERDVAVGDESSVTERIRELKNEIAQREGTEVVTTNSTRYQAIEKEVSELNNPATSNVNTRRNSKLNKIIQLSSQLQRISDTIEKMTDPSVSGGLDKAATMVKDKTAGNGTRLNAGELSTILEPFGDLIEDDYNDFIGPGSSKRFIIRDDQIVRYDFKESDQNVNCRIDVTGQEDLIGEAPGFIGEVPLIWAGATDFDLWKQYGYRYVTAESKPFFKNAETQCAPYALMLLTRQRRDTVRATLTVTGNEYYQLGDVVYITSRDMLYYVFGVSHSFTYGGTFQTTLDLRYGHPLGEFIPTPLDVIGKNLIKNQRKFNTTFVSRSTAGTDIGRWACGIVFSNSNSGKTSDEYTQVMLKGSLGKSNLIALKNAIGIINANIVRDNFDKVQVLGFITDEEQTDDVSNRITAVFDWFRSPVSGQSEDGSSEFKLDSVDFAAIE